MLPICELQTRKLSVALKVPRLKNLGTKPQERSSLGVVSDRLHAVHVNEQH